MPYFGTPYGCGVLVAANVFFSRRGTQRLDPQNFSLMVVQHTYRTVNGTKWDSQHIGVVVVHLCGYLVIYRNCIAGLFN